MSTDKENTSASNTGEDTSTVLGTKREREENGESNQPDKKAKLQPLNGEITKDLVDKVQYIELFSSNHQRNIRIPADLIFQYLAVNSMAKNILYDLVETVGAEYSKSSDESQGTAPIAPGQTFVLLIENMLKTLPPDQMSKATELASWVDRRTRELENMCADATPNDHFLKDDGTVYVHVLDGIHTKFFGVGKETNFIQDAHLDILELFFTKEMKEKPVVPLDGLFELPEDIKVPKNSTVPRNDTEVAFYRSKLLDMDSYVSFPLWARIVEVIEEDMNQIDTDNKEPRKDQTTKKFPKFMSLITLATHLDCPKLRNILSLFCTFIMKTVVSRSDIVKSVQPLVDEMQKRQEEKANN